MRIFEPTAPEQKLIEATATGGCANLGTCDPDTDNPANGALWAADRTIRAEVIRNLCAGVNPNWQVHPRGISVGRAKITGQLNLGRTSIPHHLRLINCHFDSQIDLRWAETRTLDFSGSCIPAIYGDSLVVRGDMSLSKCIVREGEVRLVRAQIHGNLNCSHATVRNSTGPAFNADWIDCKGYVLLDHVKTRGEIRLVGAAINGDFSCIGAIMENQDHVALRADCVKAGYVYLSGGFTAKGRVRLTVAEIGRDLICIGGTFENPNGEALSTDHLHARGCVFLSKGFTARGEVRLLNMRVESDLRCDGATFENSGKTALSAQNMKVVGTFRWRDLNKRPSGRVIFSHATVGQLEVDSSGWPEPGNLELDGFVYDTFTGTKTPTSSKDREEWLKLQPRFRPQPYEQLVSVLRRMGYEEQARRIAIAKQDALLRSGELRKLDWLWQWTKKITISYGYRPWLAILWMVGFILLGSAVFWSARENDVMKPAKERVFMDQNYQKSGKPPSAHPEFQPFLYSLDVFLPIVDLHQESYWLPRPVPAWPYWLSWCYVAYMVFHIIAGWLLTTLLVVGLTGLVKKD